MKKTTVDLHRARRSDRLSVASEKRRGHHNYYSILFASAGDRPSEEATKEPDFFVDLNCDQIVDALTAGSEEYNLTPFFYSSLHRVDAIRYRHEIMRDLRHGSLLEHVRSFAQKMQAMRQRLSRIQKLYYAEHQQAWFLAAIEFYCTAIDSFVADLRRSQLTSRGLLGFQSYLINYSRSHRFTALVSETNTLSRALATIKYNVLISGDKFTVYKYGNESDYSEEVEKTFARFKQSAVDSYALKFRDTDEMNHIEAKILEFVAKLYPEVFLSLERYYTKHANYLDDVIAAFDREIQFYLVFINYMDGLTRSGLHFCYPDISDQSKEINSHDGFDIVMAHKLARKHSLVVCNDFYLKDKERVLVVSGPNQGGKTTFARAFGQLHYLAAIGLPVPGRAARLFLFDRLFTHFEREEKVENLRGKLEDDLMRIHDIIVHATSSSIVILNEVFTSTTIQDETFLSTKIMERISALDLLGVWVTFVDELSTYGANTVSMMSTVASDNPAVRTFKVIRKPADGSAFALAIAQKYRLTYDSIKERVRS